VSERGNSSLRPIQRAAILLMTIGEENAAAVLKNMGPKEVQRVGAAMAELNNISRSDVEQAVYGFVDEAGDLTGLGVGNDQYIRKMLVSALGEDKAKSLADRILIGGNTSGLDTLKWMDARSVAGMIRYEHPQIQAIVIAYLDGDHAAEVLVNYPPQVRLDIMMRVARLDTVQPEALQELNRIFERQFSGGAGTQSATLGGVKTAAEIINNLDSSIAAQVMEGIREENEEMSNNIQDRMFVFDNLLDIADSGIQALLREISSENLILALKGADEALKQKIFGNMSKRAGDMLRDDLEAKGPVRVSEVEAAQKEILAVARRLADAGTIILSAGGGEEML
jgi:flagellar motor switch protein FliG